MSSSNPHRPSFPGFGAVVVEKKAPDSGPGTHTPPRHESAETLAANSHYTVAVAVVAGPLCTMDTHVVAASDDAVLKFEIAGRELNVVVGWG